MFFNTIAITFQWVFQRISGYFAQAIIENFASANFDNFQRIIGP